jgi:hypothetical protein
MPTDQTAKDEAASAMLAALKGIDLATQSHANGFGKKEAMIQTFQNVQRIAANARAQAEAAGIKPRIPPQGVKVDADGWRTDLPRPKAEG